MSYEEINGDLKTIKENLEICLNNVNRITPSERTNYENPQYRMWSGNIKNLKDFTNKLEEWLNHPLVAEAKRYLLDIKSWSRSEKEIILDDIEKDWKFLSDNVKEIKEIHNKIDDIRYETIKKKASTWVLNRIIEKDISRAKNWAINASMFSENLEEIEGYEVNSKLAEEVKNDVIEKLSEIESFDEGHEDMIKQYQDSINDAEDIVEDRPKEINEQAIFNTYKIKKKDKEIEDNLYEISEEIERIKDKLIDLEWVKKITNFKNYNKIWLDKQNSIKKRDLEKIVEALNSTQQKANKWKDTQKREIENVLIRLERMSKSVEDEKLKKEVGAISQKIQSIDWNKPNVNFLYNVVSQMEKVREKLRDELIKIMKNKDAITIIEYPGIIEDLGKKKGWNFDRFIDALEIVLRDGLIEIMPKEGEK